MRAVRRFAMPPGGRYLLPLLLLSFHLSVARGQSVRDSKDTNAVGAISGAVRAHDFVRAEELCKQALAAHPEDYRVWTLRGMAAAGLGDSRLALAHYQHALTLAPSYLPALEGTAQTGFQLRDATARPALRKILALRPDDPTSNAMLGVLDVRERNCSEAVQHLQKAGSAIAGQFEPLAGYGMCLSLLGQHEEAVAPFADALALDPTRPAARYNLALAQWNAHGAENALNTLEPLLKDMPGNADALELAADIFESKNDTAKAVDLLRKAILSDPKNVNAYLQFAMVSYDHASPQVGIDVLNAGLTQLPKEPRLYLVRGVLLTQLGEFAKASGDFEAASRIDPQLHFLRTAEGIVRSQQHDAANAIAQFRAAIKAHPEEAYGHYLLAEALQGQSQPEGSPGFKEMIEEAKRALRLEPRLVAAHDLLAAVYVEFGQPQMAIEHSRAALAIDPGDQQAVYHLILALRKSGDKDELPALVKKLMELQKESKSKAPAASKYRLYEVQSQAD